MDDPTSQLCNRLLILIEQVKRDQTALHSTEYSDGDRIYARLFDSLQSTLHNLDGPAEAAKPCGES